MHPFDRMSQCGNPVMDMQEKPQTPDQNNPLLRVRKMVCRFLKMGPSRPTSLEMICDQIEPLLPVPEMVYIKPTNTDMVIKSEPVDVIKESAFHDNITATVIPCQLVEHSYAYMEQVGSTAAHQQELSLPWIAFSTNDDDVSDGSEFIFSVLLSSVAVLFVVVNYHFLGFQLN